VFSLVDFVIFLIYSEQSVDFKACSRGNFLQLKYLAEEDCILCSKRADLKILLYKQYLDTR